MSGLIGPLKWTSSNTNVATVNSSGKVSAKKSGKLLRMKKSIRIIWTKWILLTALQL